MCVIMFSRIDGILCLNEFFPVVSENNIRVGQIKQNILEIDLFAFVIINDRSHKIMFNKLILYFYLLDQVTSLCNRKFNPIAFTQFLKDLSPLSLFIGSCRAKMALANSSNVQQNFLASDVAIAMHQ